jgi:broad specificity phosphatase PhoE
MLAPYSPGPVARIPMSASNEITAFFSHGAILRAIIQHQAVAPSLNSHHPG